MRKIRNSLLDAAFAALFILGGGIAVPALGQFETPVFMAPLQQIEDELGKILQGVATAPGDLVITYRALGGVIESPGTNGVPHPNNIPVATSGVGALTPSSHPNPGVFGVAIGGKSRPSDGHKLFVRVFNAPTMEEASFYADSQLVTVSGNNRYPLVIGATETPLDAGDDDGDGLNNSFEKSLNTDSNNPDSDGDGVLDGDEHIAGTDALDEDSLLEIMAVLEASGNDIMLFWQSVSGRTYQVQADAFLADTNGFLDIPGCEMIATSDVSRIIIPDQLLDNFYNYRVVVEPLP